MSSTTGIFLQAAYDKVACDLKQKCWHMHLKAALTI